MDSLATPQNTLACPESLINERLGGVSKSPFLLFRIAVAEAENWLFADADNFSKFIGCAKRHLKSPDEVADGKKHVIKTAGVGWGWNVYLSEFVRDKWNPRAAAQNSKSLRRTINRLQVFPNET